jgi:indolepyruvate ferredoxin oxidoreductase
MRAMELNGVQIAANKAAFEWGRRCAHDLAAVRALFQAQQVVQFVKRPSLDELVTKRVDFLTAYQNARYAADYRAFVERVRLAEAPLGSTRLAEAVARYLFKLMAYKDEYEVARLHTDASFVAKLGEQFEGDFKLVHHLAPPLIGRKDADGKPVKTAFGPWIRAAFPLLARLKGLRGTPLDVFGWSAERREERALIDEYRKSVEALLPGLSAAKLGLAVELARVPEGIRGYGHVKAKHLVEARAMWAKLEGQWRA